MVFLTGFLFLVGTVFFIFSARPTDPFATRVIDAEVYAGDYLFASMYFLRFTSLFLIATLGAHLFGDRKDHALLARTTRRRLFLAKSVTMVLLGLSFVLILYVVLVAVYAFTPFRHAAGLDTGMAGVLLGHVVHASLVTILAALGGKKAGIYLVILPGYLFADLLCDFPLDKSSTAPPVFFANAIFANFHPLADGGFGFLTSYPFLIFFASALFVGALVIHEASDF